VKNSGKKRLNTNKRKLIIFADLDGTLLDKSYHFSETEEIIQSLVSLKASIVFASSKTRNEVMFYRGKLKVQDPFIVENGSAIFIPKNYFRVDDGSSRRELGYKIIELGPSYEIIRKKLRKVKLQTNAEIVGFGDMTIEELAKDSGLPLYLARLAKKRQYSEPLKIISGDEQQVFQAIKHEGLCYTKGGRYIHVLGCCDKGKAVTKLQALFQREYGKVYSIGVGNSENDLPMLRAVDAPFFINNTDEISVVWNRIKSIAEKQA
jgi:mannosyl-3-phosphoglycerate phosphatase